VKIGAHRILIGDVMKGLETLPDVSVHCCVTSPPYWGLRDYGVDGQIGLEPTPDAYVARMVAVFREVRRVLRDDGTCWVNLGDSYASSGRSDRKESPGVGAKQEMKAPGRKLEWEAGGGHNFSWFIPSEQGRIKPKDLVGIPWRVAFALQADGWYLRSDIIWSKPNPMPESVTDRPTKAHEYLFLLSKSDRYWYDAEAIKEPADGSVEEYNARCDRTIGRRGEEYGEAFGDVQRGFKAKRPSAAKGSFNGKTGERAFRAVVATRNRRTVWTVATKPYPEAHFATYPPDLIEPCILAGCPEGGTVLDPFSGSGTTGAVACPLGRNYIGCELNPEYAAMSERRIGRAKRPTTFVDQRAGHAPLFVPQDAAHLGGQGRQKDAR